MLDEPTNDLDIETLELLEELLQDYNGTLFLVSHDRQFLDNVVTSVIAAEPKAGVWREYVGGFYDWQRQSGQSVPVGIDQVLNNAQTPASVEAIVQPAAELKAESAKKPAPAAKVKLSYKEQRELEALPAQIEALEAEQKSIEAQLADGSVFVEDPDLGVQLSTRLGEIEEELLAALERWETLDSRWA